VSPEELFWDLAEPLYEDAAVSRSTMMGLPCLRLGGQFFASLDRRSGALLVKLSADRVGALISAGHGESFAPAGRVFREWVAIPEADRRRWRRLLAEARDHAAAAGNLRPGSPAPPDGSGASKGVNARDRRRRVRPDQDLAATATRDQFGRPGLRVHTV
jgi:hypothetical protein